MRFTAFHLAWRNLTESRSSLLFLLGAVAAGVGFQVPNTANLDGYQAELMEHGIRSGFGDVRVRAAGVSHIDGGRALAGRLRADARVFEAVSALTVPGAAGKNGEFRGAALFGVSMERANTPFRLLAGQLLDPGDEHGVIVGSSLASRLGLEVGDDIQVRAIFTMHGTGFELGGENGSDRDGEPDNDRDGAPDNDRGGESYDDLDGDRDEMGRYTMTVTGLAGGPFGASQSLFLDYDFLAREAGLIGSASQIFVYLHDHDIARAVAREITETEPGVEASAWMDDDAFVKSAIASSRAIGAVSETMVVFAVAIPVLALLFIHVLRRRRDIGLLSAIGFSPLEIFSVFLLQAVLIGVVGIALGCAFGYGVIVYFQSHPIFEWEGFVVRPLVSWRGFLRPALVVFAVTVVAGAYPAWRAARVDPARVLRGAE